MKNKFGPIVPLILIFVILPIGLLMLLWRDRCKENIIDTALSPDGQRQALVMTRDCGPAIKVATEVRLGIKDPRNDQNPKAGTTQALLMQGVVPTRLNWRTSRLIDIAYPKGSVIVSRRHEVDDVRVVFGDL